LDPLEKGYSSLRFPSVASPFFPESEWEDAKRTLPSDVFRQEYEAEFLEDSAGVFRNVEGCLIEPLIHANSRELKIVRDMVIGCDVAKHTDFTVLIAMDAATGRCWAMDRFNHLDWPIQKERIVSFVRKYRGRLILDATGVGDPIFDDLKGVLPDVEGFKLSAVSKTSLIQRLIVGVEQQRVSWPGGTAVGGQKSEVGKEEDSDGINRIHGMGKSALREPQGNTSCWDVLTNEMKRYEYAISASGNLSYNAPSGYHDDCVIALALANHGRWEAESSGRMLRIGTGGAGDGRLELGDGSYGRAGRNGLRERSRVLLG
jgi:hypothetical protein